MKRLNMLSTLLVMCCCGLAAQNQPVGSTPTVEPAAQLRNAQEQVKAIEQSRALEGQKVAMQEQLKNQEATSGVRSSWLNGSLPI